MKDICDKQKRNKMRLFLCFAFVTILMSTAISGFTSAATIIDSEPEDGAADVSIEKWITIRFNTTMDTESVEKSLEITPSLDPYGYRLEWSNDDKELLIKPNSALAYSEEYEITFHSAEDSEGNRLESPSFLFETESSPGILGIVNNLFNNLLDGFISIVPNLILLVLILIVGYFIAKGAGWAFSKTLNKLGFDKAMGKVGVASQLKSIGIKSSSKFLGIFVFWFIFVMVIQIAISAMGVPTITNILAPIVLFIPRILVAALIILVGLYLANVLVKRFMDQLGQTALGKQLKSVDKKVKTSGFSMVNLLSLFIKVFILLFFVEIALEIINIGLLSEFITPVLLIMPLILVALFIILIGLIVTEIVQKAILKLFKEFEIQKLIQPVEETIGRKGVIINVFTFVIKVIVMLIFIQLSIGVLNSTGAFDPLANLINMVILWMPNVLAALVIILIGFWFAGWTAKKVLTSGKSMEMPFPETMATAVKFLIIYLAGVMAIAQLGFEVPILYIVTAIVLSAVFIGLGAGFAIGSKDIFANIGGYVQNQKVLTVGKQINVDDKYKGKVQNIGHYSTTLIGDDGKKIIIPNSQLTKAVIIES